MADASARLSSGTASQKHSSGDRLWEESTVAPQVDWMKAISREMD